MKNKQNFPQIELREEDLIRMGYKKVGKDILGENIYRLKLPYYMYQIQVVLGPYPKSNPNCGIVSIYSPPEEVEGYTITGKKKIYKIKEKIQPIAWYVDTPEKLFNIVVSLTTINI